MLYDPMAISFEDDDAVGGQRFVSIGRDAEGRILVVVHSYGVETIRLIAARRATRNEIRTYEEGV